MMYRLMRVTTALVILSNFALNSVTAAEPPAGTILWLSADAGVTSDGNGVTTWADQSGNGYDATRVDGITYQGTMSQTTRSFPAGNRDVIRFNKDGFFGFTPEATEALRLPDLAVYAVVENTGEERRNYLSNYSNEINWGYGYNLDMEGGSARAFTSNGTEQSISDWVVGNSGPVGMNYLTTVIDGSAGHKAMYESGNLLGDVGITEIGYTPNTGMSVGTLGALDIDYFFFRGDIAEILVYPAAHGAEDMAAVHSYLNAKYVPEPVGALLMGVGVLMLFFRRCR